MIHYKRTMISYAQFEEDVVILNALDGIDYKEIFYIDVGANDALSDSVTFLFYLFGSRGINIEPQTIYKDRYDKIRTNDINLFIGIGNKVEDVEMRGHGQAATFDLNGKYAKGNKKIIHVDTLSNVCDQYVPKDQEIHFLKIDVEGYEKQVLEGMDFKKHRPWIICLESYEPGGQAETRSDWEYILIDNHYSYAYTRGVNRYYCAEERKAVFERLKNSSILDTDFEIIKTGDFEAIINSKFYRYTASLRVAIGCVRKFLSNITCMSRKAQDSI